MHNIKSSQASEVGGQLDDNDSQSGEAQSVYSFCSSDLIDEKEARDLGISLPLHLLKSKNVIGNNKEKQVPVVPLEEMVPPIIVPVDNNEGSSQNLNQIIEADFSNIPSVPHNILNTQGQSDNEQWTSPTARSRRIIGYDFSPRRLNVTPVGSPLSQSTPGTPIVARKTGSNIYGFVLQDVLDKSDGAKKISEKIVNEQFILRSDRQTIAAILVDAVILNLGIFPSKEALEQLAKHLVTLYPLLGDPRKSENGYEMWFFNSPHTQGAVGFLEERLKNQRKNLAKRKTDKQRPLDMCILEDWSSEFEDDNPEPEEEKLTFLHHNFGEEVKRVMKETVLSRRTIIRRLRSQEDMGIIELMDIMPRLFDTEGMIVQDFNLRHPKLALVLYNKWPKVSKLLLAYAEQSGVNYSKRLNINKPSSELDDDDIMLLSFCLLPFILPSCGRKETVKVTTASPSPTAGNKRKMRDGNKKQGKKMKSVKASDLDSLESMMDFYPTNTHVAEIIESNNRKAPFIVALGVPAILKFTAFYVIIDKVAIPCGSRFLVALDTCFKCYTVLLISFPLESFDHWMFIAHGVAGLPHDSIPPVVQALVGQIMPKIL